MFFECSDMSINIMHILDFHLAERSSIRSGHHPFHALTFRIKGGSHMQMEDGSTVYLGTGDIAFVPADLVYTQSNQEEKLLIIRFVSLNEIPVRTIKKFTPKNPEYFRQLYEDIHNEWLKKKPGYIYVCKSKFYKIVYKIEQELSEQLAVSANNSILDAAEYVHENFTDPSLTINFLAARCGLSTTCFREQFYNIYSTTPLKYINNLRFNYASELLASDYYTVAEISEKCGFNSTTYFSLFIKKQTGMSPTSYRKQLLTPR